MRTSADTPEGLIITFEEKVVNHYRKSIKITKDGITIRADIDYDDWDGYQINWYDLDGKEIIEPSWASKYAEATSYHELAYYLDEMAKEEARV